MSCKTVSSRFFVLKNSSAILESLFGLKKFWSIFSVKYFPYPPSEKRAIYPGGGVWNVDSLRKEANEPFHKINAKKSIIPKVFSLGSKTNVTNSFLISDRICKRKKWNSNAKAEKRCQKSWTFVWFLKKNRANDVCLLRQKKPWATTQGSCMGVEFVSKRKQMKHPCQKNFTNN